MLTKEQVQAKIAAAKGRALKAIHDAAQEIADLTSDVEHGGPSDPKDPGSANPVHSQDDVHEACTHLANAAAAVKGDSPAVPGDV